MAEVFLAKSFGVQGFEKLIAIKRILPTMAEDQEFIQMFIDEAKIAGHLSHANIVPIYELGKIGDAHYIAMEFVWGKDLLHIVNRFRRMQQRMPPAMAAWAGAMMCDGLDYAHSKRDRQGNPLNLVHRDISPQNVLISYEGHVKLIDFGIARAASRSTKTQAGVLKGKFGYMSPEQVRGKPIDHRSDLFAIGTVIYEMITCERLFMGESDVSTLEKVRTVDVAPLSDLVEGVPKMLDEIVLKALAREPDDRYQNAAEMRRDLQRCLATQVEPFGISKMSTWMKEAFAEEIAREKGTLDAYATVGPPSVLKAPEESPAAIAVPDESANKSTTEVDAAIVNEVMEEDDARTEIGASPTEDLAMAATEIFFNAEEDLDEDERIPTPSSEFPGAELVAEIEASATAPSSGPRPSSQRNEATQKHQELRNPSLNAAGETQGRERRVRTLDGMRAIGLSTPADRAKLKLGAGVALGILLLGGAGLFAATRPALGRIKVMTVPAVRAKVEVDGELRGTAPLVLEEVAAGARKLRLQAEGYAVVEREVTVPKDGVAMIEVALVEAEEEAPLEANTTPKKAEPQQAAQAEAPVQAAPSRSNESRRQARARAAKARQRNASSRPKDTTPGILFINTVPVARVYIDGKDTGQTTPIFNFKISPGSHRMAFRTKSGKKKSIRFSVKPGESKRINERLR